MDAPRCRARHRSLTPHAAREDTLSATLTELRKLSESSAELLLQNIATDHVASRASRMLALTSALAEVDTVADVVEVILDLGMDVVEANCGLIGRTEHGAFHCIRASGYD